MATTLLNPPILIISSKWWKVFSINGAMDTSNAKSWWISLFSGRSKNKFAANLVQEQIVLRYLWHAGWMESLSWIWITVRLLQDWGNMETSKTCTWSSLQMTCPCIQQHLSPFDFILNTVRWSLSFLMRKGMSQEHFKVWLKCTLVEDGKILQTPNLSAIQPSLSNFLSFAVQ